MATDWAADVKKYVANANDGAIAGIVSYCGIALRKVDSSLVAFSDKTETDRVRNNFLKKKLGRTEADSVLDAAIAKVGQVMKADRTKNRVTVYYLLAAEFKQLEMFVKKAPAKAPAKAKAPAAKAPAKTAAKVAGAAALAGAAVAAKAPAKKAAAPKAKAPAKTPAPVAKTAAKPAAKPAPKKVTVTTKKSVATKAAVVVGGAAAGAMGLAGSAASKVTAAASDAGKVGTAAVAGTVAAVGAVAGTAAAAATGAAGAVTGAASGAADKAAALFSGGGQAPATSDDNGGMGWLWWLLAAAALLFAAWWFLHGRGGDDAATTVVPTEAAASGDALGASSDLTAAPAEGQATIPTGEGVTTELRDGKPVVKVYFASGKTSVAPAFGAAAAGLKGWLDGHPGATLEVSGYADPTGNAAQNAALSKQRAQAVQADLITAGVPEGSAALVKPASSTDATVSKESARRVEVVVK